MKKSWPGYGLHNSEAKRKFKPHKERGVRVELPGGDNFGETSKLCRENRRRNVHNKTKKAGRKERQLVFEFSRPVKCIWLPKDKRNNNNNSRPKENIRQNDR